MKKIRCILFLVVAFSSYGQDVKKYQFYNQSTLNYRIDKAESSIGFSVVNGIQFKNRIGIGMNLGMENLFESYFKLANVGLEGRYQLFQNSFSPFISLNSNVLLNTRNMGYFFKTTPGGKLGAAIGVNWFVNDRFGITASVGYQFSQFYYWEPLFCCWCGTGNSFNTTYFNRKKMIAHGLEFKVGIALK
jgi:hypothetical protein